MRDGSDHVHVALVSRSPAVNLLPATVSPTDGFRGFPPAEMVLIETPDLAHWAECLAAALERRGVITDRRCVSDGYSLKELHDALLDVAVAYDGRPVMLNMSGGTSPMAAVAYDMAQQSDWPVYCVDIRTDHVQWQRPPEGAGPFDIPDRAGLEDFLLAHGWHTVDNDYARERKHLAETLQEEKDFTQHLLDNVERYKRGFGVLNYAATTADRRSYGKQRRNRQHLRSDELTKWKLRPFCELVSAFEDRGYLWREGDVIVFPDEERRFFVNGGWLERHVYNLLAPLHGAGEDKPLQDLDRCRHVEGRHGSRHELDIVFLANNRLHVVECKTSRFEPIENPDSPGSKILYKVDRLKDLGGETARTMLVSYRYVPWHEMVRADDMDIPVVTGVNLHTLDERLLEWIRRPDKITGLAERAAND